MPRFAIYVLVWEFSSSEIFSIFLLLIRTLRKRACRRIAFIELVAKKLAKDYRIDIESKMVNKTQARRLVENIFEAHGYVPQEIWDQMSPEVRTVVKAAMLRKDEMIASSVKTYASYPDLIQLA